MWSLDQHWKQGRLGLQIGPGVGEWSTGLLWVGASMSIGSSLVPAALAAAAIASVSEIMALTSLAPWALRLLAFWKMSPPYKIVCQEHQRWCGLEEVVTCSEGSWVETDWYDERDEVESTDAALTGEVPGSMMVEEVSSLSEGGDGTGIAGDGADDHNGGLGTATLLK